MEPNLVAEFSSDRRYRYTLWRDWSDMFQSSTHPGYIQFIGLNPSTADEVQDDPTVRRCINYVRAWGYSRFCMTNLFAYRSTDPQALYRHAEPVGQANDAALQRIAKGAAIVIAAWGTHGNLNKRDEAVKQLLPNLRCLRLTKDGFPAHPLYLPKTLLPINFVTPKQPKQ